MGICRHIAADCMSKLFCWNCKELGHCASECNNDPICHNCGKRGHLTCECSNSGHPRICNCCLRLGHMRADCTNEKACNNCRQIGHLAQECTTQFACNVSGHVASQCPKTAASYEIVAGTIAISSAGIVASLAILVVMVNPSSSATIVVDVAT